MKATRIIAIKNPVGRPRTGIGTMIGARWSDAAIKAIDDWRRQQPDVPSRAEAIRRLVDLGLRAKVRK